MKLDQKAPRSLDQQLINLTLPYPPTANNYWRMGNNRIHRTKEAEKYIAQVRKVCQEAGIATLEGSINVTVEVYRPAKRGDLDNSLKVLLDSLRGCAYADDRQIVEIHAHRYDNPADPCVVVTIERWGL
jgi:crossover junction endodeoxyribonuclease RusA